MSVLTLLAACKAGPCTARGIVAVAGECLEAVSTELSFFTLPNCFELFGFDLLVDEDWHIWLLEVFCHPWQSTNLAKAVACWELTALRSLLSIPLWYFICHRTVGLLRDQACMCTHGADLSHIVRANHELINLTPAAR